MNRVPTNSAGAMPGGAASAGTEADTAVQGPGRVPDGRVERRRHARPSYRTETLLRRELRVRYPAGRGRMVLRTELNWGEDVEPLDISEDGETSTFALEAMRPFLYVKVCLRSADGTHWSVGPNMLVLMTNQGPRDVFPYFQGPAAGSLSHVIELDSTILGRKHLLRIYFPPGYRENTLRRYPVLYMQDGKNLFFPEEAFGGREWQVDETLQLLDGMNAADRVIVVGIYSGDRTGEYTKPGYEAYARSVAEEVKPEIQRRARVLGSPQETGVIGSSLGGVVSFYMAWQHPEAFGYAGCMSSPFSLRDDLIDRVLSEPVHASKFYLDSGWPGDNYEVTAGMAMALNQRGYRPLEDFLHLVFPHDQHDEGAWGRRLHIPVQLGLGPIAAARRGRFI
ncbi:MAG TPA: alpha/beta hydrolase-fold protein [Vicinamibacteria bacterium]|nr:alpha/beta hydrolase-fold protein [Vicinamibacteria bacterium]